MPEPGEVMVGGHRRLLLPASLATVLLVVAGLLAIGSRAEVDDAATAAAVTAGAEAPARVAGAYLAAWEAEDWTALQALTADPALDAAGIHAEAHRALRVSGTRTRLGAVEVRGERATAAATVTWDLGELGEATHAVELSLGQAADGSWRVRWWYPTVHPDLTPQRRFQRVRAFQERAPILDHAGNPLAVDRPQTPGPDRDRARALPGLAGLLGEVGEVTSELLEELGEPYRAGDAVGRSGLERLHERRLAGEPQLEARIVEGSGLVTTLAFVDGKAPEPLRTTLDADAHEAAAAALDGVAAPAALVALDVATGEIRAAVSTPAGELRRALEGRYPPGSTAKIVTAAAALEAGWSPEDEVDCPPELPFGDRALRNAGGDGPGRIDLTEALARSCNTAFAALAEDVGADALLAASEAFGFGVAYDPGLPAFGGAMPAPASRHELALTAIGQGRVEASPLHMASVVAAAASGTWRAPHLLRDAEVPDGRPLDDGVAEGLAGLLRAAVAEGTGRAADLAGEPVLGKTGSAEYGTGEDLATHAWFVGVRGDLAVAVLVEGGGAGGAVAAPLAAAFWEALEG